MRWQMGRRSDNIEDQRGGGFGRIPLVGGGGIGLVLLFLLIKFVCGVDPLMVLDQGAPPSQGPSATTAQPPSEAGTNDPMRDFVSAVLAETEDVWHEVFQQSGATYEEPRLVLFTQAAQSACGFASAASGPFYCPGDRKVYLDLSFFRELQQQLGAPGDFAQAYVIAHEVGHHVQNLLGITEKVGRRRGRASEAELNALSVRLELQADFLAGVWAHHAQRKWQVLEPGDIEEALNAASQIGDDRLQKRSQGYVVPDAFTHGTSAQRVRWFRKGLETGDLSQGDTFSATAL